MPGANTAVGQIVPKRVRGVRQADRKQRTPFTRLVIGFSTNEVIAREADPASFS